MSMKKRVLSLVLTIMMVISMVPMVSYADAPVVAAEAAPGQSEATTEPVDGDLNLPGKAGHWANDVEDEHEHLYLPGHNYIKTFREMICGPKGKEVTGIDRVGCALCGSRDQYVSLVVVPTAHREPQGEAQKAPDWVKSEDKCDAPTTVTYKCTVCGDTVTYEVEDGKPQKDHTWEEVEEVSGDHKTTLTFKSYEQCSVCGEKQNEETENIAWNAEHEYVAYTVTATKDGAPDTPYTQVNFPEGGKTSTDSDVKITVIDFDEIYEGLPAATITELKNEAIQHYWDTAVEAVQYVTAGVKPTWCTYFIEGATEDICHEHGSSVAVPVETHDHNFGSCSGDETPAPAAGEHTHSPTGPCTRTSEATCTKGGVTEQWCTVCKQWIPQEGTETDPIAHTLEKLDGTPKKATCKEDGTVTSWYCSVCKRSFFEDVTDKVGDEANKSLIDDAKLKAEGWKKQEQDGKTHIIISKDTVAHNWMNRTREANCSRGAQTNRECTVCGKLESETWTDVPDSKPNGQHEYYIVMVEGDNVTDATAALKTAYTEQFPEAKEVPTNLRVFSQPTCTKTGTYRTFCKVCGESVELQAIPSIHAQLKEQIDEKVKALGELTAASLEDVKAIADEIEGVTAEDNDVTEHMKDVIVTFKHTTGCTEGEANKICDVTLGQIQHTFPKIGKGEYTADAVIKAYAKANGHADLDNVAWKDGNPCEGGTLTLTCTDDSCNATTEQAVTPTDLGLTTDHGYDMNDDALTQWGQDDVKPKCGEPKEATLTCPYCGATKTGTVTVEHNLNKAQKAAAKENALSEHPQNNIPGVKYTPETCTTAGFWTYTCLNDGCDADEVTEGAQAYTETENDEAALGGHKFLTDDELKDTEGVNQGNKYVEIKPATCITPGAIIKRCTRDGCPGGKDVNGVDAETLEKIDVVEGQGHEYAESETLFFEDCEQDGWVGILCKYCGTPKDGTEKTVIPGSAQPGYHDDLTHLIKHKVGEEVWDPKGGEDGQGAYVKVTEADCMTQGIDVYTCPNCQVVKVLRTDALEHKWNPDTSKSGDFTDDVYGTVKLAEGKAAADCVNPELEYVKCDFCQTEALRPVAGSQPKGHDFNGEDGHKTKVDPPAVCQPGMKEYWHCKTCDKYFLTDDLYNKESVGDETLEIPAAGKHSYPTEIPADAEVVTPATCTEPAVYKVKCQNEGCTQTTTMKGAETDASGHKINKADPEGTVTVGEKTYKNKIMKAPDCKSDATGIILYHCTLCGANVYEVITGDATETVDGEEVPDATEILLYHNGGHYTADKDSVYDPEDGKPATCLEDGQEAASKCQKCGDTIPGTGKIIPATGHEFDASSEIEYQLKDESDCTKGLTKITKCAKCQGTLKGVDGKGQAEILTEPVEISAHTYATNESDFTNKKAASPYTNLVEGKSWDNGVLTAPADPNPCTQVDEDAAGWCILCGALDYSQATQKAKGHVWERTDYTDENPWYKDTDHAELVTDYADHTDTYPAPPAELGGEEKDPTCTETGVKLYKCKYCEDKGEPAYHWAVVAATGHKKPDETNKDNWKITPATCDAPASGYLLCENEKGTDNEHAYTDDKGVGVSFEDLTSDECKIADKTGFEKRPHKKVTVEVEANCVLPAGTLTYCEYAGVPVLDSDGKGGWTYGSTETPAGCSNYPEFSFVAKDGSEPNQMHPADSGLVANTVGSPSCTSSQVTHFTEGERTTCKYCGAGPGYATVPGKGHVKPAVDPVDTPATCTKTGEDTYTCEKCGQKVTETILATGHKWATEASELDPSYATYVKAKKVPDKPAAYSGDAEEWNKGWFVNPNDQEATCKDAAEPHTTTYVRKCLNSNCDETYTSVEDYIDHKYTVEFKEATCTEPAIVAKGERGIICEFCGKLDPTAGKDVDYETFGEATGHQWRAELTDAEGKPRATCETAGTAVQTCTVCGYPEEISEDPTGHNWVAATDPEDAAQEVEATCVTSAKKVYVCNNPKCDKTPTDGEHGILVVDNAYVLTEYDKDIEQTDLDALKPLGHDYEWTETSWPATLTDQMKEDEQVPVTFTCSKCKEGTEGHTNTVSVKLVSTDLSGGTGTCVKPAEYYYGASYDDTSDAAVKNRDGDKLSDEKFAVKSSKLWNESAKPKEHAWDADHADWSKVVIDASAAQENVSGTVTFTCPDCSATYEATELTVAVEPAPQWKPATCTEAGSYAITVQVNIPAQLEGAERENVSVTKEFTNDNVPATGHTWDYEHGKWAWGELDLSDPSNPTTTATVTFTCTKCQETSEAYAADVDYIPANSTPATCQQPGSYSFGASYEDDKGQAADTTKLESAKLEHNWNITLTVGESGAEGKPTVTGTATCQNAGCTDSPVEFEVSPANVVPVDPDAEPDCTKATEFKVSYDDESKNIHVKDQVVTVNATADTHTYAVDETVGDKGWTWSDDGVTLAVKCSVCKKKATLTAELGEPVTKDATCETAGTSTVTATVSAAKNPGLAEDQTKDKVTTTDPATEHHFTYTVVWEDSFDEMNQVPIEYTCDNPGCELEGAEQNALATLTTEGQKDADCENEGSTGRKATFNYTYTSEVTDGYTQTLTYSESEPNSVVKATGHNWDLDNVVWSEWSGETEDDLTITMTISCLNNPEHKIVKTFKGTADEGVTALTLTGSTEATCTEPATATYTATATFDLEADRLTENDKASGTLSDNTRTSKSIVTSPALGHNWQTTGWVWTKEAGTEYEEGISASITFTCSNNGHDEGEKVFTTANGVTVEETASKDATCVAQGSKTLTATLTAEGFSHDAEERTFTTPIDPQNHDIRREKVEDASCTEGSLWSVYCANGCGEMDSFERMEDKLEHKLDLNSLDYDNAELDYEHDQAIVKGECGNCHTEMTVTMTIEEYWNGSYSPMMALLDEYSMEEILAMVQNGEVVD